MQLYRIKLTQGERVRYASADYRPVIKSLAHPFTSRLEASTVRNMMECHYSDSWRIEVEPIPADEQPNYEADHG